MELDDCHVPKHRRVKFDDGRSSRRSAVYQFSASSSPVSLCSVLRHCTMWTYIVGRVVVEANAVVCRFNYQYPRLVYAAISTDHSRFAWVWNIWQGSQSIRIGCFQHVSRCGAMSENRQLRGDAGHQRGVGHRDRGASVGKNKRLGSNSPSDLMRVFRCGCLNATTSCVRPNCTIIPFR